MAIWKATAGPGPEGERKKEVKNNYMSRQLEDELQIYLWKEIMKILIFTIYLKDLMANALKQK